MPMKKVNKIAALIAGICLINAGCAVHNEEPEEPQGMVTLQVCIAESQWDQSIDGLTKLYLKEHPEIKDIEWILVRQNSYWDLMDMKLATGTLPDIMEVGAGEKGCRGTAKGARAEGAAAAATDRCPQRTETAA